MKVAFLGINNIGWDIYEWLNKRSGVSVQMLITNKNQLSMIKELKPDLVLAVGYHHIIPKDILSIPKMGCINVHPGYLPHTRGFNPNVWSIIEGHPSGATIHYMDEEVDTGDIISRCKVEKSFSDSGKTLYKKIEQSCFDLFTRTWPKIESNEFSVISQDHSKATQHHKSEFKDLCEINPDKEYQAKNLVDILRSLTFPPFNNAYMKIDGEKYFIEVNITHTDKTCETEDSGFISSY